MFRSSKDSPDLPVIVVSGLPRSGTSLMMQMLEAGGVPLLVDAHRSPDVDNPHGYYEFEPVRRLHKNETGWLDQARGRAIKVISALLPYLPPQNIYRVLFMQRRLEEVLRSQEKMRQRLGSGPLSEETAALAQDYLHHLAAAEQWLQNQPHIETLFVNYNQLIAEPLPWIDSINTFLGGHLQTGPMHTCIRPELYRQRITGE